MKEKLKNPPKIFVRENYAQNGKDSDKFIVKGCE